MSLRSRLAGNSEVSISGDIQEFVEEYLYDKVIGDILREPDFIDDCKTSIKNDGIEDEIYNKINELAAIIKKAADIAEEKSNNY